MGLFNRYCITQDIRSSFCKRSEFYCHPEDYAVTEEDCRRYLDDLEKGDKLNTEWNRRRRSRWTLITLCVLLTISIPTIIFISYYFDDSTWGFLVKTLLSWSVLGISLFVYNAVDSYFQTNKIHLSKFYPEVNENIERLFDDYLWKCKLADEEKLFEKTMEKAETTSNRNGKLY